MLTHEQIWRGIDELAAYAGTSPSGLARRAGLDATTFNPSKRRTRDGSKPRWPSTESLSKALQAAHLDLADFARLACGGSRQSLPGLELAEGVAMSAFDRLGRPSGDHWVELPFPDFDLSRAYALSVDNDHMAPVFRPGSTLIVSREAAPRAGDRIMVQLNDGALGGWTLGRFTVNALEVKALNPTRPDRILPIRDIDWVARIIWASQ